MHDLNIETKGRGHEIAAACLSNMKQDAYTVIHPRTEELNALLEISAFLKRLNHQIRFHLTC